MLVFDPFITRYGLQGEVVCTITTSGKRIKCFALYVLD